MKKSNQFEIEKSLCFSVNKESNLLSVSHRVSSPLSHNLSHSESQSEKTLLNFNCLLMALLISNCSYFLLNSTLNLYPAHTLPYPFLRLQGMPALKCRQRRPQHICTPTVQIWLELLSNLRCNLLLFVRCLRSTHAFHLRSTRKHAHSVSAKQCKDLVQFARETVAE